MNKCPRCHSGRGRLDPVEGCAKRMKGCAKRMEGCAKRMENS